MIIRVEGGTDAGTRTVKNHEHPRYWAHVCDSAEGFRTSRLGLIGTCGLLDWAYTRCPACGRKRP